MIPRQIRCVLYDLDDTLYPQENGIWEMIRQRINQYLLDEMHFPPDEVPTLRHRLWSQYGTTLRGLQAEYAVDMDAFLNYVHDIPLENILKPDQALDQALTAIPQRKVIFTNANAAHARRVIHHLGVSQHFETIVDIYTVAPFCKPEKAAFHKALEFINEKPEDCLLVDDSPKNLATAQLLGMQIVSVGSHRYDGCPHIDTIHQLPPLFTL